MNIEELKETSLFNFGEENVNFAEYFDGTSYLGAISLEQVPTFNVSFEPGCRNHWHIHHAEQGGGQLLLVTAGRGWYQEWGGEARELKPGDVVSVVEKTSRGWFVKHNGTSGWYYGELKMLTEPEDFIPPPKQKKWDNNWQKNLGRHKLK